MTHFLTTWGYVALLVATFLAATGIPTGSEVVIAYAGALASGRVGGVSHHFDLLAVIALATIGELVGSLVGFWIGRVGGRRLVLRAGRYVLLTMADLDRAERLFRRHGDPVVFFGRFVPLVRSFVGIAAGIAEMGVGQFVAFTGLAAAIWCSAFALLGAALGARWNQVLRHVSQAGDLFGGALVLFVVVLFVLRVRAVRVERHAARASIVCSGDPD